MFRTFDCVCYYVTGALLLGICTSAGAQPWKAPGPPATPDRYNFGSSPSKPLRFRDAWYFTAADGLNGASLWKTDGTQEGTRFCLAFRSEFPQFIFNYQLSAPLLLAADDHLFLWSDQVVWSTDGTPEGTQEVWRAQVGKSPVVTSTGLAWLAPMPGTQGDRVWVSDGTPEGTRVAGGDSVNFGTTTQLLRFQDALIVGGTRAGSTAILFLLNLESGELVPLSDTIRLPSPYSRDLPAVLLGESLVFFGIDRYLYVTRGTPESTFRLSNATSVATLTPAGSVCYFIADGSPLGRNLWVTDGTQAGTRYITSNNPNWAGTANYTGDNFMAMDGDVLWFSAYARNGTTSPPFRA